MTTFPADAGTWLVDHDPEVEPVPIVGWRVSGPVATPILPILLEPVTGQAYRLPGSGAVIDPAWGRTFVSEDSWRAHMDEAPYDLGVPLMGGPEPKKVKPTKKTAASAPSDPDLIGQLEFGTKQLKNRSFWRCNGDTPFVFVLEGGKVLPVGENVEKITRDEFYDLRKSIPENAVDPDNLPESEEDDSDDDLI